MIVLDEHFDHGLVLVPLSHRLKSRVVSVRELRPGTVIKDEAIPALLQQCKTPTFVTGNVTDFWRKLPAHAAYCLVCVPLTTGEQKEIPNLVHVFLRHPGFRSVHQRMGKVILLNRDDIRYYTTHRGNNH